MLYATLTTFRTVGPFELNWDTQQYKCWISQYITFSLLAILQVINLFWLFLIVRVAFRIVFSEEVTDLRSDNEDDEEVAVQGNALEDKKKAANIDVNGESAPKVLLNGRPVRENGSVKTYRGGTTRRR